MYADNGKISNRQTFRLYVFDLMGISTLLIPPYLAKLSGNDGIFAICSIQNVIKGEVEWTSFVN